MVDLAGTELGPEEAATLRDPLIGGVILFGRNYASPGQVRELVAAVHGLREPHLLVAVDQEGGRVQRFREGYTHLPAPGRIGASYGRDPRGAVRLATTCGWLMATELRAVGVDLSFAPVLDLNRGVSRVIGDRAFHADPEVVATLARAYMKGMRGAGMMSVGKHFPGHGGVRADSHQALPVDERPLADLRAEDLLAFERMAHYGIAGVMPAHVVYPAVDPLPAGFSEVWLKAVLRGELGFHGAVFSDDLSMAGAAGPGGYPQRARAALSAGCDMVLLCNCPEAVPEVLSALRGWDDPVAQARLVRMHGRLGRAWEDLGHDHRYLQARGQVEALDLEPELDLGDDSPA